MKTEMTKQIMNFHADSFGIVHHGRYLEILEEARWQYVYENNLMQPFIRKGIYHVVAGIHIDYLEKARPGDELILRTEIGRVTEKSVVFRQTAWKGEKLIVTAEVTDVFMEKSGNRIVPVNTLREFWSDLGSEV